MKNKKNRTICVVLVMSLLSGIFFLSEESRVHTIGEKEIYIVLDLNDHWAKNHVVDLIRRGYVRGYEVGAGYEIRPDNKITRAEFVSALVGVTGFKKRAEDVKIFNDVNENDWYKKNIDIASSNGLIEGNPDQTFNPNEPIKRAEIVSIIVNLNGWTKGSITKNTMPFTDVAQDKWYTDIILTYRENWNLAGYPDGTFRPENFSTRAEAFVLIAFVLENLPEVEKRELEKDVIVEEPNVLKEESLDYDGFSSQERLLTVGKSGFKESFLNDIRESKKIINLLVNSSNEEIKNIFGLDLIRKSQTLRVAYQDTLEPGVDGDYNDFIVDITINEFFNDGILRALYVYFHPKARGASYEHQLYIELKDVYRQSENGDIAITWNKSNEGDISVSLDKNYDNQEPLVVFESTKDALSPLLGFATNTVRGREKQVPNNTAGVFIILNNEQNKKEERTLPDIPNYSPLLSLVSQDKRVAVYEVEPILVSGYPHGFVVPTTWRWMAETINIKEAYPDFFQTEDWYENIFDESKLYTEND